MAVKQPYKRPTTIPLYPAVSSRTIASGRGQVLRRVFRETSGAASVVLQLFDGTGTNGVLLDTLEIAQGASAGERYRGGEFLFDGSLYVNVVSGQAEGLVVVQFLGPGDPYIEPVLALTLSDLAELEGTTLAAEVATAAAGSAVSPVTG